MAQGTIRDLCASGDTSLTWDTTDQASVDQAIRHLEAQLSAGRAVFTTEPEDKQIRKAGDFDPQANTELITVPAYQGG